MGQFRFDKFIFCTSKGELSSNSDSGRASTLLRYKVSSLLKYLIDNRDRVVSKDELLDQLWQQGDYRENSLTQSIRELRKALGDKANDPTFIKTYQQRGYQWICPVQSAPLARDKTTSLTKPKLASLFALLLLAGLAYFTFFTERENLLQTDTKTLLVLPFINQTGDKSMDWLELGLADMVASQVQQQGELKILSPVMANGLLSGAEIDWPPLAMDIRALLAKQDLDKALLANVRLHNQQQVLEFQLISRDGSVQQGAMTYASLPNATSAIASQLLHLLSGKQDMVANTTKKISDIEMLAKQTLAKGIQASHTLGPVVAAKLLQASNVLDPSEPWSSAYLARSQVLTGNWQDAEARLKALSQGKQLDLSLLAFVHYWLAELATRRGDPVALSQQLLTAKTLAEQADNSEIKALVYRLKAQQAWQQMQWQQYNQWIKQADALFPRENDLHIQADKLFYLGDPAPIGPDKDPQTNLVLNQTRLEKAHNFYLQLGNLPMVAASLLAIAQNYHIAIERRQQALTQAIELYNQLNQPYELAKALAYQGFVEIQLRNGKAASKPLAKSLKISQNLGAKSLEQTISFYLAFAKLDQGLDQSAFGRHKQDPAAISVAISAFNQLLPQLDTGINKANTLFMLGWAYSDLAQYSKAIDYLQQAEDAFTQLNLATSAGYGRYSQMRIYLSQKQFDKVIALADPEAKTKFQYTFLARAYYEQGEFDQAIMTLNQLQQNLSSQWHTQDAKRLATYLAAQASKQKIQLPAEPLAHAVYCESDWQIASTLNKSS